MRQVSQQLHLHGGAYTGHCRQHIADIRGNCTNKELAQSAKKTGFLGPDPEYATQAKC